MTENRNITGFGFLRLPKIDNELDWERINGLVDRFMELGGTYFDTCYTYLNGMSEEAIRRCVTARKPRESFLLADKLPGYLCKSYEDNRRYFDEELKRCGVDYFDVFMLHWLNAENYAAAEKYDEFRFLREVKSEGRAKRIGFSYHDGAALLDEILSAHPEVDVVQLQINYLDWESSGIESKNCYDVCVKHGKSVIVMEPVKGGTLADIPETAEKLLADLCPGRSPASWAIRFVQSLPAVEVCLSGMNAMEQVEDNMQPFAPLTDTELAALQKVKDIILGQTAVACTGCRYCEVHCPKHIPIPDIFKMYNEILRFPEDDWKIIPAYGNLTKHTGKAGDCISCGSCAKHCPQHLHIPEHIHSAATVLEKG